MGSSLNLNYESAKKRRQKQSDKEFREFYENCKGNMYLMLQRSDKSQRALEIKCKQLGLKWNYKIV